MSGMNLLMLCVAFAWTVMAAAAAPSTDEADERKTRRYYLSLSPLSVTPELATPYQDVVLKAGVVVQGLAPGVCPDPARVTVARREQTFRLTYPFTPCTSPNAFNGQPVEVKLGRRA